MTVESQEILRYLLEAIVSGEFAVGELLPTEMVLAKKFKTNRMNASAVLKLLEENDFVSRKKRQGTLLHRIPSKVEVQKLFNPFCTQIDIMATLDHNNFGLHWNSMTLSNLERKINTYGYNLIYHDFSKLGKREELEEYLEEKIGIDSFALVLLPIHGIECKFIIDNYDLFLKYHDNVYLLDNGTTPVSEWPFHRISQSPFLEGLCVAEHLLRAPEENVVFLHPSGKDANTHYLKERRRGLVQGLRRTSNSSIKFKDWHDLDIDDLKNNSPVLVSPYTGLAAEIIDELSSFNMTAGKDYRLIAIDDNIQFHKYNITAISPPLDKYGDYLGELICQESYEKKRGNKISIDIYPYIIERQSYITKHT